jgi:hypothetical protein
MQTPPPKKQKKKLPPCQHGSDAFAYYLYTFLSNHSAVPKQNQLHLTSFQSISKIKKMYVRIAVLLTGADRTVFSVPLSLSVFLSGNGSGFAIPFCHCFQNQQHTKHGKNILP